MSRRLSCSMTVDAVRDRTKTVTRRHPDTWRTLAAGDRLTLIEKGMGLPKGAKQVVLAEVEVVDVRVEPIGGITPAELILEGLPHMSRLDFIRMWLAGHGYRALARATLTGEAMHVLCRRIEWRYLP